MESNSSIYEPLDENTGLNCWHKTFASMCWCLDSKPYTDWEVSVTNLTARSTPWECEGKSSKLIFSPVNNYSVIHRQKSLVWVVAHRLHLLTNQLNQSSAQL